MASGPSCMEKLAGRGEGLVGEDGTTGLGVPEAGCSVDSLLWSSVLQVGCVLLAT